MRVWVGKEAGWFSCVTQNLVKKQLYGRKELIENRLCLISEL